MKLDIKSVNDNVYDYLFHEIIEGRLKSGDKIVVDALSKELGVSSTPIRDAFKKLELQGLLEVRQRSGSYIKFPSEKEISDLFNIRLVLESYALEEGYEHIKVEDLNEIEEILQNAKRSRVKADYISSDEKFHSSFINASNNQELVEILDRLRMKMLLYRNLCVQDSKFDEAALEEHLYILEALKNRDIKAALSRNKEHILNVLEKTLIAFRSINNK
jgi:DNA-binding GntR family transcriptional regulator